MLTKEQAYDQIVLALEGADSDLSPLALTPGQWDVIHTNLGRELNNIVKLQGHPPLDKLKRKRPTP